MLDRRRAPRRAGIVDQDVDQSERGDHLLDHRRDGGEVAHVADKRQRLDAELLQVRRPADSLVRGGGWALDLFRGEQTRDHEDLEISVPAGSFDLLPPLFPDIDFYVPQGQETLAPMTPATLGGESHQTWAFEPAAGVWRFDVFREPHDGSTWVCRRDESIRLPYADIIRRTADGPLPDARGCAALQGERQPREGPGRFRRGAAAAHCRSANVAR